MHSKKIAIILIFLIICFGCTEPQNLTTEPKIIPIPLELSTKSGYFILDKSYAVVVEDGVHKASMYLMDYLATRTPLKLDPNHKNKIEFVKSESIKNDEGYHLTVSKNKILVEAKNEKGAFYAVQSLIQLFPVNLSENNKIIIPCVEIKDEPKFKYRGMHLDVGRHMYSVDFIKKYIDALAILKMNTFHWHLTEDQGWRIEIKKYPKLQEVAAYRDETLVGHYSDQPHQFDGKRYGGYYTQEEIKDIVSYAQKRCVTIIPEIEMPGHSQATIAAYPELGCTDQQVEVAKKWGVFDEVYCPTEKTFTFLEDVINEVIELFPSKYIHIGGDEAPKTRWRNSSYCQEFIKQNNLKDEHGLQSYFIQRMEKYINSKGRKIIGWDEILEGGLAPNATVMSWRGINGAIEAAKQHHDVIMTPTSHCYFDYYQSENQDEPLAIGGFLPLEKVYSFNPIPEELSENENQYVLGAQGNIWTEYMPTEDQVEYMAFPRILAMSEVVWSHPERKNYKDFVSRVEQFHKRLDALDINYANHLYEINGKMNVESGMSYYQLETLIEGKQIRYTLNGSEPSINSKKYESKIPVLESVTIKAAVFNSEEQLGKTFHQTINYHKAVGATITIDKEPNEAYKGSGAQGLINGISGSDTRYGDREWLGFWGEDIEVTIDFKSPIDINSIETRFHNGNGQWIYAPKEIEMEIKNEVEKFKIPLSTDNIINFKIEEQLRVKTLKLKIPNYGIIPEGKQGSGHKAWTFIDEIIIN